jgi:phosphoenolpyruvate-protein kinase (PTS system EI component)
MWGLERAVKVAKSMGVTSSICGQAPSVYPELTEKLVEWGITSVSVSPDMIDVTREIIAKAEERLKSYKPDVFTSFRNVSLECINIMEQLYFNTREITPDTDVRFHDSKNSFTDKQER